MYINVECCKRLHLVCVADGPFSANYLFMCLLRRGTRTTKRTSLFKFNKDRVCQFLFWVHTSPVIGYVLRVIFSACNLHFVPQDLVDVNTGKQIS